VTTLSPSDIGKGGVGGASRTQAGAAHVGRRTHTAAAAAAPVAAVAAAAGAARIAIVLGVRAEIENDLFLSQYILRLMRKERRITSTKPGLEGR